MAVGNTEFPKIVPSSGENVEFLNIFSTRDQFFEIQNFLQPICSEFHKLCNVPSFNYLAQIP